MSHTKEKIETIENTIKKMEERLVNQELHPIAMDNQYRAIAKLKELLRKLKKS